MMKTEYALVSQQEFDALNACYENTHKYILIDAKFVITVFDYQLFNGKYHVYVRSNTVQLSEFELWDACKAILKPKKM
jgi:hypothetical protein